MRFNEMLHSFFFISLIQSWFSWIGCWVFGILQKKHENGILTFLYLYVFCPFPLSSYPTFKFNSMHISFSWNPYLRMSGIPLVTAFAFTPTLRNSLIIFFSIGPITAFTWEKAVNDSGSKRNASSQFLSSHSFFFFFCSVIKLLISYLKFWEICLKNL